MDDVVRVLCVCTHNRTRSVMTAALLDRRLADAGVAAEVASAGLRDGGHPPTEQTVRLLADAAIDVARHTSRRLEPGTIAAAHLIVTAEPEHVLGVAGMVPDAFERTFTLPELVELAARGGARRGAALDAWLEKLAANRPDRLAFLAAVDAGAIPAVADPTGGSRRDWQRAWATIDRLTARLVELVR